jgi:hypothetical protein
MCRLKLIWGQRVDEQLAHRHQVRHCGATERGSAVTRKHDLGAPVVGGAIFASNQASPLHPTEMV